ncbi:allantoate permease [Fusarium albosuccineum]|uniref:Allantoate permease n=1 Tax=Fusarium albosuccineum TaxID=1237068 RepID=A0A8H4NY79_9HYPO|nr:allantoate permease [Fusarium albosuccineum]
MEFNKETKKTQSDTDSPPSETADTSTSDFPPSTGHAYGSVEPHVFSHPARAEYWRNVYDNANLRMCREIRANGNNHSMNCLAGLDLPQFVLDLINHGDRLGADRCSSIAGLANHALGLDHVLVPRPLSFLAAELPGGLISKKVGPFRYTPTVIVLWGALCMTQAAMNARWNFWLLRALLGVAQGGFIPEMVLYLSYLYKGNELPVRLSIFYTAIPLTQIYGSLLAGGLLEMRGVLGWGGWQWLFLIEGLICVLVGITAFFVMPPSITEPALAFKRPDGTNKWWTEEEEKILVNRLLRDDPTKGDLNNRTAVTPKGIWQTLSNFDLWPIFIVGIFAWIPFQPTANYLSLILREMGYSVFQANLLAIPGYALFAINVLIFGWISSKLNERFLVAACSNLWMLPFFCALVALKPDTNGWIRYAMLTGINGIPYTHSILVGMVSQNAKAVGRRAVAAAIYNMTYQIGSIGAVNIYREGDKPYYYTANKGLVGLCVFNILLFVLAKLYYVWRNRVLARQYADLPETDKARFFDARFVH